MKTFTVKFRAVATMTAYIEVEASNLAAAMNKARKVIAKSDDDWEFVGRGGPDPGSATPFAVENDAGDVVWEPER